MKVIEVLEVYATQLEADGRSPHTIAQARRHVGLLARFVGERELGEIGHEDVARFLASAMAMRTQDGRAKRPTSQNALRSSVRCFCAFACAAGYASVDPARLVRRARCPAPQPQALTEAEAERLVAALATAITPAERRDRALFTTMLRTGIRLGTAVALDVGDLDLDAGQLHLRLLKNGGRDVVFVPKDILELLREHLGGRTEGALFQSTGGGRLGARQVHRRLGQWAKRAGIGNPVHPHSLRHTFAQRLFRATSNVMLVGRALCHRSVASTQVYVRPDEAMVRAAVGA